MKKTRSTNPLRLSTESIRQLNETALRSVKGGATASGCSTYYSQVKGTCSTFKDTGCWP